MAMVDVTFPSGGGQGKILKWRVAAGTMVSVGRVLLLYHSVTPGSGEAKGPEKKLRATRFGRVVKLLAKEADILQPGQVVLVLEGCKHPTVMKDLCAECGADLRDEGAGEDGEKGPVSQASVPMVHSIPELKVCPELAEKIGKEDEQRLLGDRKLALLVDLDQTIVHTTNDNIPPDMKDVYHYQLYGPNSPWYHTRLRPGTRHFLSEMSTLYELHICTFGARNYAHAVAALLDKDGTLFSHRILSRDECFDPLSKTANLKALFPCGDDMVCIIDDREDVWQGCGNLVQVKPYHFFRHTGDIHAPPGLAKPDPAEPSESADLEAFDDKDAQCASKENGVSQEATGGRVEKVEEVRREDKVAENSEEKSRRDKDSDGKLEKAMETDDTRKSAEESTKAKEIAASADGEKTENKEGGTIAAEEKQEIESERKPKKDLMDEEDHDDYLLYLEDILRRIHAEFYSDIKRERGDKSLRDIIPRVRAQTLKNLHLTFSGLIPTHQKLHENRAYKVARALGAEVTQDLTEETTHLVAIKPGTAKANAAKKNPNIKVVNPDWLWTCAERWERVDERLFPLTTKARGSRIPPPHCSSPERIEGEDKQQCDRFADSINPLMSFTQEEIDIMDKEVEEDMSDQDADPTTVELEELMTKRSRRSSLDSDENLGTIIVNKRRKVSNESSTDESSSEERDEIGNYDDDDDGDGDGGDGDDDDDPIERFKRGDPLDDLDFGDNSQDSMEMEALDNEDEGEWNAMGAALERELSD